MNCSSGLRYPKCPFSTTSGLCRKSVLPLQRVPLTSLPVYQKCEHLLKHNITSNVKYTFLSSSSCAENSIWCWYLLITSRLSSVSCHVCAVQSTCKAEKGLQAAPHTPQLSDPPTCSHWCSSNRLRRKMNPTSPSHQPRLVKSHGPRDRDKADEVHVRGSSLIP